MKLLQYIQSVLHPAWYHGDFFSPPYFEGWYFKVINADKSQAYAFIPGVYVDPDPKNSHAFIQALDGNTGVVHEQQFPISAFSWQTQPFEIRIGENRFSLEGISLDLSAPDYHLTGELFFAEVLPWKVRLHSPGIMGWFGWLPFLECYHGLLSFDHLLRGELVVNDEKVVFDNGRGYIEKDWGKSFPSSWVWMQSNHFNQPGTSLSASVAVIPFLGMKFTGVIVGLWHIGRLYRFTTYNGVKKVRFNLAGKGLELVLSQGKYKLHIKAQREAGGFLAAPTLNGMDRRIMESLQGKLAVKFYRGDQLLFDDCGERAGMEIVGTMKELIK